ncbi:MAG: signal peptidase I [Nitriliruptor sp.]|nr:MAG: signal peptidase I [Nitriliruptor sp.]
MGTDAADTRRWLLSAAGFGADVYLYLILSLAVWVLLPTLLLGWAPILVSSGSMSPAIKAGDIVLIDEDVTDDPLPPGAIITYRQADQQPDRLVTHRIRDATDAGAYVTRGDANDVDDAWPVPQERVVGYARLLVPMLGLPIHWARTGSHLALYALAGLSLGALGVSMISARTERTVALSADEPSVELESEPDERIDGRAHALEDEQVAALPAAEAAPIDGVSGWSLDASPLLLPEHERDVLLFDELSSGLQAACDGLAVEGADEPMLWSAAPPSWAVTEPDPLGQRDREAREHGEAQPGLRARRARAAKLKAIQPVVFLALSAGLIAGGVSLPVTEAAFTVAAPNTGNLFATAPAEPEGDPLPPQLILPPLHGQDSFTGGQQPETISFDFPVPGATVLDGTAVAILRVRPSTPGNPPRSVGVALRGADGQTLAAASVQQQGWDNGWTDITLALEDELVTTLEAGSTLTVEVLLHRLELDLSGASIINLPVTQ